MRVGCDIVFIPRFKKTLARTPEIKEKLFLKEECADAAAERLAGIFAAKEAVTKAAGIQAGQWHHIRVAHDASGAPCIKLSSPYNNLSCNVSISHDGDYAFAVAVCT